MTQPSSDATPNEQAPPASAEVPQQAADDAGFDLTDPQIGQTFELLAAEIRSRLAQIEAREAALEQGERCVLHSVRRLRRMVADRQRLTEEQLSQLEVELEHLSEALAANLEPAASGATPDDASAAAAADDGVREAAQRADDIQRRLLENIEQVRRRQRELSERLAEARRRLARRRAAQRSQAPTGPGPDAAEPLAPQEADDVAGIVVAQGSAPLSDLEPPPARPPAGRSPAALVQPPRRRRPWLRSAAVALFVACGAAGLLWWFQRPAYVAEGELRIFTDAEPARTVVSGYAARMLATQPAAGLWSDAGAAGRWQALRARGSIDIVPDFARRSILVRLRDEDPAAGAVLAAGLGAWQRHFEQLPPAQRPDPRLVQWQRQRELVEHELAGLRLRERELLSSLPAGPASQPASAPTGATADAWRRLQRRLAEVQQRLAEAREALAALENAPEPRGHVTDAQLDAALKADPVYTEDTRELASATRQLRSDAAVAMVLLEDPLSELRAGVQKLGELVAEQQKLQPPPDVAAVLDAVSGQLDALLERVSAFVLGWKARREKIERLRVPDELDALLGDLDDADADARQLSLALQRAHESLLAAVSPLDGGDAGSTRAVIVAAMLRGELTRLRQQIDAVMQAAKKFTPRNNPALDAGDRQVRNLRERLTRRRQRVRAQLQAQADARAREQRARRIRQARAAVAGYEQQRDELTEQLIAAAGRQGQREQALAEIRERTGQLLAVREQIRRAQQRLDQLDCQQREPPPIRFRRGQVQVRQIGGQDRVRNTAIGGVIASVAVWLLCMLVFSGRGELPASTPSGP